MPMDPSHLQILSEQIVKYKDNLVCEESCSYVEECIFRSAINRSYYAAYSFLKQWAVKKLKYNEYKAIKYYTIEKKKRVGRHEVLILYIIQNSKKVQNSHTAMQCANKLRHIKDYRTIADYKFNKKVKNDDVETVFKESKNIIKYVNLLYNDTEENN